MKELLLQERWRPKNIEDLVILKRILNVINNNKQANFIFYGDFGIGKTSLARILGGRYTKENPLLEINVSLETSIDTLRGTIDEFCSKMHMGIDLDEKYNSDSIKYVILDEFERASKQFQDALKVYIEDYSAKNVRFILITNHISKVSKGILSRMTEINFNCLNKEEEKELKTKLFKRINDVILPAENLNLDKSVLKNLIIKFFPDLRKTLIAVDTYIKTGDLDVLSTTILNDDIKTKTYNIVYGSPSFDEIYHFLMDNYGADNIDIMINYFGRDFIKWVYDNKEENTEKLFKVCDLVCRYNQLLDTQTDPLITGISFLGNIKSILSN